MSAADRTDQGLNGCQGPTEELIADIFLMPDAAAPSVHAKRRTRRRVIHVGDEAAGSPVADPCESPGEDAPDRWS